MKKDHLYGWLDPNTLEWTDGIFTKILRKVCDVNDSRGHNHLNSRAWIVFDGDCDPDWAGEMNVFINQSVFVHV